jgi:uncharacterized damage-inducible protein DinB
MTSAELLIDAFDRVRETVHEVLDGLTDDQLTHRLDADANSIAWLVWHLTRVQDDHVAGVAGIEQVHTMQGFADRFGLPFDDGDIGYGHSSADVAQVRADAESLRAYHDAVHRLTVDYVATLTDDDLPRVVDPAWNPPVTLAVRLISVVNDASQHAGQAAFVRGILDRA